MEQLIQDKTKKPAGLVPKNLQAFLLVGLALLMVVIMALTGHKPPVPVGSPTTPALPTIVPVNADRVTDFQRGIEQSQRESAPQAEAALLALQRQLASQTTGQPPSSNRVGTQVKSSGPNGAYPPDAYAAADDQQPDGGPLDAMEEGRRKRAYLSLFSDNVALSYRKELRANSTRPQRISTLALPLDPATNQELQSTDGLNAPATSELEQESGLSQQALRTDTVPERQEAAESSKPKTSASQPNVNPPAPSIEGKKYVLFEGTVLETLLINRLDGSFSGPIVCLLSTNVYSHDRQHVLIPSGSKILGETKKVDASGQERLAVVFHRLLMPDGFSVNLDQFQGLDQVGATALKDKVNNHYVRIFGASLALGVLGGVAQLGTASTLNTSASDRIREGFGTGMASAGEHILDKFLNVLPTVTIREGSRIKIYLSGDLVLPDYAAHTTASDI